MSKKPIVKPIIMTDVELAQKVRAEMTNALASVCSTMNEALASGITVGFNIGIGGDSRYVVTALTLTKTL